MPTAPLRTRRSTEKHAFGKLSLESSSEHHSLPPRKKPGAERPWVCRPLSPRARERARRLAAKPREGCLPGLGSGAVREGGPFSRPHSSAAEGLRKRLPLRQ